ncbi:hypothetical protein [Streptomyces vietnamensis]|uniref:hypothetical protein n=1 Tax=Streptomyces vietnamensis TaxID=362257 RepID=UPI00131A7768|nr:hypothetical protein [Streptomyces vietnamensis]
MNARRGRDGRMRSLDAAKARPRAAELIAERPDASLRHIAAPVGLSPATVSDVRRRLASGLPPAGPKHHPAGPGSSPRCHRTGAPSSRNSRTGTPGSGALLRRNWRSASTGQRAPSAGGRPGVVGRPRR